MGCSSGANRLKKAMNTATGVDVFAKVETHYACMEPYQKLIFNAGGDLERAYRAAIKKGDMRAAGIIREKADPPDLTTVQIKSWRSFVEKMKNTSNPTSSVAKNISAWKDFPGAKHPAIQQVIDSIQPKGKGYTREQWEHLKQAVNKLDKVLSRVKPPLPEKLVDDDEFAIWLTKHSNFSGSWEPLGENAPINPRRAAIHFERPQTIHSVQQRLSAVLGRNGLNLPASGIDRMLQWDEDPPGTYRATTFVFEVPLGIGAADDQSVISKRYQDFDTGLVLGSERDGVYPVNCDVFVAFQ